MQKIKKLIIALTAMLMIVSVPLAAAQMTVRWEWLLDDPDVTAYRYQLDGEDPDGWTMVSGDTSSAEFSGLDADKAYTLYVQRSYDGVNWSPSASSTAAVEKAAPEEVPEEPIVKTYAYGGYELTADEIIAEWHSLSVKLYAEDVRLKPGAEELLERLSASGISMAIATDLDEELALPALRNNGIEGYFSVFSTTKAAGKDKRSPDVYLNAAHALGLRPEECLVFEDILKGIRTASATGFCTAAIYDSSSDKDWEDIVKLSDMSFRTLRDALTIVLDS